MLALICLVGIVCLVTDQLINQLELLLVYFVLVAPILVGLAVDVIVNVDPLVKVDALRLVVSNLESRCAVFAIRVVANGSGQGQMVLSALSRRSTSIAIVCLIDVEVLNLILLQCCEIRHDGGIAILRRVVVP